MTESSQSIHTSVGLMPVVAAAATCVDVAGVSAALATVVLFVVGCLVSAGGLVVDCEGVWVVCAGAVCTTGFAAMVNDAVCVPLC